MYQFRILGGEHSQNIRNGNLVARSHLKLPHVFVSTFPVLTGTCMAREPLNLQPTSLYVVVSGNSVLTYLIKYRRNCYRR